MRKAMQADSFCARAFTILLCHTIRFKDGLIYIEKLYQAKQCELMYISVMTCEQRVSKLVSLDHKWKTAETVRLLIAQLA